MKDQLDRIERELIEQEHRPLKLISNYIGRKDKWPEDKSKQRSAVKAILWRLFFSPTVIAFAGGLTAFITIGVLIWQNTIIIDQNSLINKQNQYFRRQLTNNDLVKYESIFLSKTEPILRRQRAVVNYLRTSRLLEDSVSSRIDLTGANLAGCTFIGHKSIFKNVDFFEVYVDSLAFVDTNLSNSKFVSTKRVDESSIWGFVGCNLNKTDFDKVDFRNSIFYKCRMDGIKFTNTNKRTRGDLLSKSLFFHNKSKTNSYYNSEIDADSITFKYELPDEASEITMDVLGYYDIKSNADFIKLRNELDEINWIYRDMVNSINNNWAAKKMPIKYQKYRDSVLSMPAIRVSETLWKYSAIIKLSNAKPTLVED